MTNIYILSKSYHDFMFVFCSLFIGGQKKTMWLLCTHALTHTSTCINTQHEYSTQ